jgi:hypothetical protein
MTSGVVVGILPVGASSVDANFLSNISSVDQVYHELEQISISSSSGQASPKFIISPPAHLKKNEMNEVRTGRALRSSLTPGVRLTALKVQAIVLAKALNPNRNPAGHGC